MKRAKKYYRLATLSFRVGLIFWFAETIVFLVQDGWHWKAANPLEKTCDSIVSVLWSISIGFLLVSICTFMDLIFNSEVTYNNKKL